MAHIHVDAGVCTSVCKSECTRTHECVGQMLNADVLLSHSPPYFLRQGLPLNPECVSLLEQLANELQGSTCVHLPALRL